MNTNIIVIEQLKQQLSSLISASNLSIENIYFLIKDLYRDIEKLYFDYYNKILIETQQIEEESSGQDSLEE